MATEWQGVPRGLLDDFLEKVKIRFAGQSLSVVKSSSYVPGAGAFVPIETREDAANLFLSEVLVILCGNPKKSYESALAGEFRQGCFITAESKTADIEKKLISGVHGPKECVFVEIQ